MPRTTALIKGIAVGRYDDAIVRAWVRAQGQLVTESRVYAIGVCNKAGRIYRGMSLEGMESVQRFIAEVCLLGFICDSIEKSPDAVQTGFHFVLKPESPSASPESRDPPAPNAADASLESQ